VTVVNADRTSGGPPLLHGWTRLFPSDPPQPLCAIL
jgi:hypothetical protein